MNDLNNLQGFILRLFSKSDLNLLLGLVNNRIKSIQEQAIEITQNTDPKFVPEILEKYKKLKENLEVGMISGSD